MPHKRHTGPGRESHVRDSVPAAVGVPVHVAGEDAAIWVDLFDDGDVTVVAGTLYIRLQHDDRVDMRRGRDDPAGVAGPVGPLIGVAEPVHPVASFVMVFYVGPVGAVPEGKTVGRHAGATIDGRDAVGTAGVGIESILAYDSRCGRGLGDQVCIIGGVVIIVESTGSGEQAEGVAIAGCQRRDYQAGQQHQDRHRPEDRTLDDQLVPSRGW